MNDTTTEQRLMAYLDGELPAEDAAAFETFLQDHPEWRQQAADLGALGTATEHLAFRPPPVELWDDYWNEIDARLKKPIGWTLLAIGGALLALFGAVKIVLWADNVVVRLGLVLLLAGLASLFVGVLRGHLIERAKDRYRRIRR